MSKSMSTNLTYNVKKNVPFVLFSVSLILLMKTNVPFMYEGKAFARG